MCISGYSVDGANNSTVMLQQRNMDSVGMLKRLYYCFNGMFYSEHSYAFDNGKTVDLGPAVELHFFDKGRMFCESTCVLYGDLDKIPAWVFNAVKLLNNKNHGI